MIFNISQVDFKFFSKNINIMFEKDFENAIFSNLKNLKISCNNKLAVALSGGSDSLSLTIALNKIGFNILAIIVNHNLRKESLEEIKMTIKTLQKYNIEYVIKEWDGKYKKNLEDEARKNRYKLLLNVCKTNHINYLCIGHHINDQVETFFLNLARGSGLDGLCAMPDVIKIDNIFIVRPMLNLTKQNCVDYLNELHIKWCEDASNKDTKYKRNNIRYTLEQIEDKNLIIKRVCKTINILQEVRETLDRIIEEKMANDCLISWKLNSKTKDKVLIIYKPLFCSLTSYLQKSILTKCLLQISGREYKLRLYQINNIIKDILEKQKFKRSIINCFIEKKKR